MNVTDLFEDWKEKEKQYHDAKSKSLHELFVVHWHGSRKKPRWSLI